jgi:hypothetical protein
MASVHSRLRNDMAIRILLLVVTVAIVTLCYASPIDQSWLAGLYDGGDYDDVVTFVTQAAGLTWGSVTFLLRVPYVKLLSRLRRRCAHGQSMLVPDGRAPPSPSLARSLLRAAARVSRPLKTAKPVGFAIRQSLLVREIVQ